MKHAARALALIVIASAVAGCSNGGPTATTSPTASAGAPLTPVTTASGSIATGTAAASPTAGPTAPTPGTPASTTPRPSYATVAEAGGWRLVITRPEAGATVDRSATICYQATGTTRESSVAFDVAVVSPGSSPAGTPTRLPATLGAGSVEVDLSGVASGPFDLRIGLVGDGQVVPGVIMTIPGLVIGDAATDAVCP